MTFSDILSLIEILVTILFGYYITHWVTVRDTRTRSVKELYLNQLTDIKKQVDVFFTELFDGELAWREVADWYGHQQSYLTCFDEGLRLSLPIRKRKLEDIVNDIHETITGSDFYNESFKKKKYVLNNDEKAKVMAVKDAVDKAFNEYVVQINNSRQYYFWETILQNYQFDKAFFQDEGHAKPIWEAHKIRVFKSIPYLIALVVFLLLARGTYRAYKQSEFEEIQQKEAINKFSYEAFKRIDSLNMAIQDISSKMEIGQSMDSCQAYQLNNEIRQISKRLNELLRKND